MKSLFGLFVCLFAIIFDRADAGKDYLITLANEKIMTPCKDHPNNFVDRAFDLSKVTYKFNEDDTVFSDGNFTFLLDIPQTQIVSVEVDIFKKQRGQWVSTIYNLRRDDVCRSVFNPAEFWYQYTSLIPEEDRGCPPKKGMTYHVSTVLDPKIKDVVERNADGDYKCQILLKYGPEPDNFICFDILAAASQI